MSGAAAKELLTCYYGLHRTGLSCRRGRGTAYGWLYIDLGGQSWSTEQRDEFVKECVEDGLCHTYCPDMMPGDNERFPCVLFSNYILTDGSGKVLHDCRSDTRSIE